MVKKFVSSEKQNKTKNPNPIEDSSMGTWIWVWYVCISHSRGPPNWQDDP